SPAVRDTEKSHARLGSRVGIAWLISDVDAFAGPDANEARPLQKAPRLRFWLGIAVRKEQTGRVEQLHQAFKRWHDISAWLGGADTDLQACPSEGPQHFVDFSKCLWSIARHELTFVIRDGSRDETFGESDG